MLKKWTGWTGTHLSKINQETKTTLISDRNWRFPLHEFGRGQRIQGVHQPEAFDADENTTSGHPGHLRGQDWNYSTPDLRIVDPDVERESSVSISEIWRRCVVSADGERWPFRDLHHLSSRSKLLKVKVWKLRRAHSQRDQCESEIFD